MNTVRSLPPTRPPDAEAVAFANERGFTLSHESPEFAHLSNLKRRLLSLGGWAVVLRGEPDDEKILSRAVLLGGDDVRFEEANESQCHFNAAMSHLSLPTEHSIMTGYALSADGMWRQHSWIYERSGGVIVETTERRVGYYGVLLDDLESLAFCTANVPYSAEADMLVRKHPAFPAWSAARNL